MNNYEKEFILGIWDTKENMVTNMVKVLRNTYPRHPNIPHAEVGDIASWVYDRGAI